MRVNKATIANIIDNLHYREILDMIPADIAVFDKNHKYVFVNKNAIKDDHIREWIIGKDDFDYCKKFNKPISIAESRRRVFNEALNTGPQEIEEKIESDFGHDYHIRHMAPYFDENNKLKYVIGYGVNITSVKQAQFDLEEAKRLSVIGEFAAGIAHEINNPLTVILAKSQLLELNLMKLDNLNEKDLQGFRNITKTIIQTCNYSSELIKNLKTFSSKANFDFMELVPLTNILSAVLKIISKRCLNENIEILGHVDKELSVICNQTALIQVFMNLFTNSIDAILDLEEKWIKIEANITEGIIQIIFTDSGKGIPDEISEKILQPFFTTKDPGSGTGLGLGICSKSITKMGGRFYYNRKSINTQFIIELKSKQLSTYKLNKHD